MCSLHQVGFLGLWLMKSRGSSEHLTSSEKETEALRAGGDLKVQQRDCGRSLGSVSASASQTATSSGLPALDLTLKGA